MCSEFNTAVDKLSGDLRGALLSVPAEVKGQTREIRLRVQRPVLLSGDSGVIFIDLHGKICQHNTTGVLVADASSIAGSFRNMCESSVYSYQNEIKNGYITLKGGHRVGLAGSAVVNDGAFTGIRDISSLNIRVAREINGSASVVLSNLRGDFKGVLIAGEPASGKTTMLRDIARSISIGEAWDMGCVAIVDERRELISVYAGIPQNDPGFCDILDGYTKFDGIIHALRALSPQVIVCDEIASELDVMAIKAGANAGVKFIAGIHAGSVDELIKKPIFTELTAIGAFDYVVMLSGRKDPGKILGIFEVNSNDMVKTCGGIDTYRGNEYTGLFRIA